MNINSEKKTKLASTVNPFGLSNLQAMGEAVKGEFSKKTDIYKRRFFDLVFIVGWLCCMIPGPFPSLVTLASILLCLCFAVSFFDENFYLYAALFVFMRYKMMLGGTQAYRVFSYLFVIKFLLNIGKTKFRIVFFPAIFVFALHSLLAVPALSSLKTGFNIVVDVVIIYLIVLKLVEDPNLMRKFIFAFLMGGINSGVYGWTSEDAILEFNVSGAGAHEVKRNFGALSDSNFAGYVYSLCVLATICVKKIPVLVRLILLAIFASMLLGTISLSATMTLILILMVYIILKYRAKSFIILIVTFVGAVVVISIMLAIPAVRQISTVSDLLIRITEKLSYISRGRWDLLTTDRTAIWQTLILPYYNKLSIWMKLFGGSVDTVHVYDEAHNLTACHNSYIQSILNFGVFGALLIYLPFLGSLVSKLYNHFTKKSGYENEDIQIIRIIFAVSFIIFGITVDFFIDWPYMMVFFM